MYKIHSRNSKPIFSDTTIRHSALHRLKKVFIESYFHSVLRLSLSLALGLLTHAALSTPVSFHVTWRHEIYSRPALRYQILRSVLKEYFSPFIWSKRFLRMIYFQNPTKRSCLRTFGRRWMMRPNLDAH